MESKQALKRWMPILVALVVFVVINLFGLRALASGCALFGILFSVLLGWS